MSQKFQSGWQSFLSGDIVGGIAGLVGGIFSVIKLFNQLHDNKLEKQIKQQEHQVKLMGKAYEKLEKQMEGAYSTDSIKQNTDEMLKNLEEQAAANEKMAELEQAKKDTDKEKVEQYLEERDKALEEREKLLIEREKAFGGFGGQEDYKSVSEEFVDAWLSAFKETGSGLKGLQEKFDEFFLDMIKKQLLNNVMEKSMTAFYDDWDTALSDDGRLDKQEAESLKQAWKTLQGELDSKLQAMTEVMGVADDIRGTAELGTLQKGIQGVTEDTAEIIASYLNAMRFMLGEQSSNIKSITDNYGNIEAPNTMLGQLKMIADNTRAINDLLGSVTKAGHREGGYGIKVFTD
jgi:gas vesicle protein